MLQIVLPFYEGGLENLPNNLCDDPVNLSVPEKWVHPENMIFYEDFNPYNVIKCKYI